MEDTNQKESLEKLKEISFIVPAIELFFRWLEFFSLAFIHGSRVDYQNTYRDDLADIDEKTKARTRKIEIFIVLCIVVEILLFGLCVGLAGNNSTTTTIFRWIAGIAVMARLFNIMAVNINMIIFDRFRIKGPHYMASLVRTLILTVINYFELLICFGLLYLASLHNLNNAKDWTDALYFSVTTQLTIGYGDIAPLGFVRLIACFQGLLGFMFTLFILGRFVAGLPKITSVIKDD